MATHKNDIDQTLRDLKLLVEIFRGDRTDEWRATIIHSFCVFEEVCERCAIFIVGEKFVKEVVQSTDAHIKLLYSRDIIGRDLFRFFT